MTNEQKKKIAELVQSFLTITFYDGRKDKRKKYRRTWKDAYKMQSARTHMIIRNLEQITKEEQTK